MPRKLTLIYSVEKHIADKLILFSFGKIFRWGSGVTQVKVPLNPKFTILFRHFKIQYNIKYCDKLQRLKIVINFGLSLNSTVEISTIRLLFGSIQLFIDMHWIKSKNDYKALKPHTNFMSLQKPTSWSEWLETFSSFTVWPNVFVNIEKMNICIIEIV